MNIYQTITRMHVFLSFSLALIYTASAQGMQATPPVRTIDDLPAYCASLVELLDQQPIKQEQLPLAAKQLEVCFDLGEIVQLLHALTLKILSPEERYRLPLISLYRKVVSFTDCGNRCPIEDFTYVFIYPQNTPADKISYAELISLYAAQLENIKQGWESRDLASYQEISFPEDEQEWILFVKEKTSEYLLKLIDRLIHYFDLNNVAKCSDILSPSSNHKEDISKPTMYLWVKKAAFDHVQEVLQFNLVSN